MSVHYYSQILKDVMILQAINWINRSWKETECSTIQRCFDIAGFSVVNSTVIECDSSIETTCPSDSACNIASSVIYSLDDEDFSLAPHKMAKKLFDCDLKKLISIDAHLQTCRNDMADWDRPA